MVRGFIALAHEESHYARVYAIVLAVMLTAQPAWAHHKPNHPDFPRTPAAVQIARDPCGVSHAPRQNPGFRALGEHCR